MKNIKKIIFLGESLGQLFTGKMNNMEQKKLWNWFKKSSKNRELTQNIISKNHIRKKVHFYEEYNTDQAWKKFQNRLSCEVPEKVQKFHIRPIAIAASILLFIGIGFIWLYQNKEIAVRITTEYTPIIPGSRNALLYMADGTVVPLGISFSQQFNEKNSTQINDSGETLTYHSDNTTCELIYNELVVPFGGEYCVILDDSTKVWINSGSKLKYPVQFSGDKRKVYLEGEAYFQVAHRGNQPFSVETAKGIVQVYGTSFNICAYPEDTEQCATLETGSIALIADNNTYLMSPGEQAITQNGKTEIRQVNPAAYCSWHAGTFIFEEESLEQIMKKLSRWYNVNVMYQSENLKKLHFTGDLNRYEDFTEVLLFLQATNKIRFEVKNKNISITR